MGNFLRSLLPASLAGIAAGAFMYVVGSVVEDVNVLAIDPAILAVVGFACAAGIYIFESTVGKKK